MSYILIGKIVNTHCLKGELKLISHFPYKDKVFLKNMNIYIGKEKVKETINTYRPHKQFDMITLVNYTSINEVLKYKEKQVYVLKSDIKMDDKTYLHEDLVGLLVIQNNNIKGKVKRVVRYPSSYMLEVEYNNKKVLVPYIDEFIKKVNMEDKTITINEIEGLFL
ncbi:MAG: ribosome maturation factor RimM [bacterium]|nr:ribosome maturation factor RimM [bacterium]